jgi:membrane protease YdiL (CAAX protease family)
MATQLEDRFTASTEEWRCECGRVNAVGLSMCPRCGRMPPRGVATTTVAIPAGHMRALAPPKVRAVRLAIGVIVLNIVTTGFLIALVRTGQMEDSTAITLGTLLGLVFYAVVLAMMTGPLLTLRPAWIKGDPHTARLLGAEVGFAAAVVLVTFGWLASGHPTVDLNIDAIVSEGSLGRILVAFLAVAVVAPVVEELLFRGVVCESLRRNGPAVAIGVSAFLFGLAHLQWSVVGITYYTACGVVLGLLYWRRGLWASIAAHALFNGSLVLLAVVVALGPTKVLSANGVSVTAHSDWHVVDALAVSGSVPVRFALRGPSGATFAVARLPVQFGSLDDMAAKVNGRDVQLPDGTEVKSGSARVTEYPMGHVVQVDVKIGGHAAVDVLVPRQDGMWTIEIHTEGSHRAVSEYPDMLRTLVLPGN